MGVCSHGADDTHRSFRGLRRFHGGGGCIDTGTYAASARGGRRAARSATAAGAERNDARDDAWRTRGTFQNVDPETFFPAPNEPADAAVGALPHLRRPGLLPAWALEVGDCHGVWGGTTPRERRAMLVAWRSEVTAGSGRARRRRSARCATAAHAGPAELRPARVRRRAGADPTASCRSPP
ncbi:WhiB family transcriptional regulator [Micromonospora sp. b486]|uniref:WhiB family transcriptional regulator n=1 Tax=Micromonospora sp. b486 TaxID=3053986 RepID=UPI00259D2442|nr:WhiB family transcriptional regulator [Micromonospora sp. b486]MDM4784525.1 WhiB family transcriptional regulator [Micromonospora sp. b486]